MKRIKVAVNGFGRIGRTLARLVVANKKLELVAINDLSDVHTMAHLFKYDSIHGKWIGNVVVNDGILSINGSNVRYTSIGNPDLLKWDEVKADVVVECTGSLKSLEMIEKHITGSKAPKVILSAPPEDDRIQTIVLGVNDYLLKDDLIISNASCTTNNAAPMIQLLDELYGIEGCYITTVHSYTSDQRLHDAPHRDLRRSRAAGTSIIPTTTGAAKALTRVFPHLAKVMGGCGIRVPVPDGSLTDITCTVRNVPGIKEVNEAFFHASQNRYKGILEYTEDPIVSVDVINNPHSCIYDAQLTSVIGNMVKVVGWYDNEFGYSNRLIDLILRAFNKK